MIRIVTANLITENEDRFNRKIAFIAIPGNIILRTNFMVRYFLVWFLFVFTAYGYAL